MAGKRMSAIWVPVTADHIVAVQAGELHASAADGVELMKMQRRTVDTVCGLRRARPYAAEAVTELGEPHGLMMLAWPPPQRHEDYVRCRRCWGSTGRPRPNPQFRGLRPPAADVLAEEAASG